MTQMQQAMDNDDEAQRVELWAEEKIRVAALNAAVQMQGPSGGDLRATVRLADLLTDWIYSGELPKPKPGEMF